MTTPIIAFPKINSEFCMKSIEASRKSAFTFHPFVWLEHAFIPRSCQLFQTQTFIEEVLSLSLSLDDDDDDEASKQAS
jgi:hypothetical protein